jgi:hypothetical protein
MDVAADTVLCHIPNLFSPFSINTCCKFCITLYKSCFEDWYGKIEDWVALVLFFFKHSDDTTHMGMIKMTFATSLKIRGVSDSEHHLHHGGL